MTQPKIKDAQEYKSIRLLKQHWDEINALADDIGNERGAKQDLTKIVVEAINFYKKNRKKGL